MKAMVAVTACSLAMTLATSVAAEPADHCRNFQLAGVGLVGKLDGTGDDPKNAPAIIEALNRSDPSLGLEDYKLFSDRKNFALVMVSGTVSFCPDVKGKLVIQKDRAVDLRVNRMGDATSLEHGMLLPTPLIGPDAAAVYALGKGPISVCSPDVPGLEVRASLKAAPTCVMGGGEITRR